MAKRGTAVVVEGVLSGEGYGRLKGDVARLLAEGKAQAEAAVGFVLAVTYWRVGTRISKEALTERAGYREGVMEELARDLALPIRTLQYAVRFSKLYETQPASGLSWSHYRELIGLTDDAARAFYENAARAEGWSVRRLVAEIKGHGFAKQKDGSKAADAMPRPSDANYLYRCEVERVIDGDTLVVLIDLGFDVIRREHVRLVDAQAAEAGTKAGDAATRFVRETLARAQTVVVKTARNTDARGRYLAYVFYSGDDADAESVLREGSYLNGELVRAGMATVALDRTARR